MAYTSLPPGTYVQNGRIIIPGLTGDIPTGNLRVRVKASGTRPSGELLVSNAPFTADLIRPATPDAPTFISYSDTQNTFTFAPPAGYNTVDCDYVIRNGNPIPCTSNTINVGSGALNFQQLVIYVRASLPARKQGLPLYNNVVFTEDIVPVITPATPVVEADDVTNTLRFISTYGDGEILLSTNNAPYESYQGTISVGNMSLAAGFYKAKVKSATGRAESAVASSPAFTATVQAQPATPPTMVANDAANTLDFGSPLGDSEILVSTNNGAFVPYSGSINVGDVDLVAGYYKAKIKAGTNRLESSVVSSPAFTKAPVQLVPAAAPTNGIVDDVANTFNWTNSSAYQNVADYEFTLDGGATVSSVTTKPLQIGNVAKAANQVGVRVKAGSTALASSWLYNTQPYTVTVAAPSFSLFLTPGPPGNNVDSLTWSTLENSTLELRYNPSVQQTASTPYPPMAVFLGSASNQVGNLDFASLDDGHLCGVRDTATNKLYYRMKVIGADGALGAETDLKFTPGNILLIG